MLTKALIAMSYESCDKLTKYSRMDQVKFVEDSLLKFLLGPFLNTLSQMNQIINSAQYHVTIGLLIETPGLGGNY